MTMGRRARLFGLLAWVAAGTFFVAGTAQAASFYMEILTSDAAILQPKDVRARANVTLDVDPLSFSYSGGIVGSGLGSGEVSPDLTYQHIFEPGQSSGAAVDQAWLFISIRDDRDLALATVEIELDGQFWQSSSQVTLNLLSGNVTAQLDDNLLDVTITAGSIPTLLSALGCCGGTCCGTTTAETLVIASVLKVKYDSVPLPEPNAAVLFIVGAAIVGAASRKRLSS